MNDGLPNQIARDLILESYDCYRATCARRQTELAERLGVGLPGRRAPEERLAPAADLALYGRGPDGASPMRRYFHEISSGLSDLENEVLDAMCNAVFSLFRIVGPDDCAGVRALDLLSGETLWIVDRELERTGAPGAELALRVFHPYEFWMTTGAMVELNDDVWSALEDIGVSRMRRRASASWLDRDALAQAVYHLAA